MNKNQFLKLLVLFAFVAAFVGIGLYMYNKVVKKNSFKPEQFQNGQAY
jgi:hypothetical protein